MFKHLFTSCLLLAISSSVAVAEMPKIDWALTNEAPTFHHEDGKFSGHGVEILRLVAKKIPGYDHKLYSVGNYARLAQQIEKGPSTCGIALFKTEARRKVMLFSDVPSFYFFNIQLVMNRTTFEKYGEPQSLSLEDVLKDPQNVLGLSKGRTYAKELRKIITGHDGSNITTIAQGNTSKSLSQMVAGGRITFTFAYPGETAWISHNLGERADLVTVPISEINTLSHAFIACSKGTQGEKIIAQINASLAIQRPTAAYRKQLESWLTPNLVPLFRKNYAEVFLNIAGS